MSLTYDNNYAKIRKEQSRLRGADSVQGAFASASEKIEPTGECKVKKSIITIIFLLSATLGLLILSGCKGNSPSDGSSISAGSDTDGNSSITQGNIGNGSDTASESESGKGSDAESGKNNGQGGNHATSSDKSNGGTGTSSKGSTNGTDSNNSVNYGENEFDDSWN